MEQISVDFGGDPWNPQASDQALWTQVDDCGPPVWGPKVPGSRPGRPTNVSFDERRPRESPAQLVAR